MMNEQPTWYEGGEPRFGRAPSFEEMGAVMFVCGNCSEPDSHTEDDCPNETRSDPYA